jgi:hypothetical protein
MDGSGLGHGQELAEGNEVIYDLLSRRQKQAVDLLMSGACCKKPYKSRYKAMAEKMGIVERVAMGHVRLAANAYGIDAWDWDVGIRLCYLRAKELGMI